MEIVQLCGGGGVLDRIVIWYIYLWKRIDIKFSAYNEIVE